MSTNPKWKLILVCVEKEPTNQAEGDAWEPTRDDVAVEIRGAMRGTDLDTGWHVSDVVSPHLDVETLGDIVKDANLTGEQTVELMGRITGDSIERALLKVAEGMRQKAEEVEDAAPRAGRAEGAIPS